MNLYAVFLPSPAPQALEQAVFVRQGFSLAAFALTPFWTLWRRLWLAFGLWAVWAVFVVLTARFANLDSGAALALYALGALAFGLEADQFRQARLAQQGYVFDRLALGSSQDEAESLYFGAGAVAPPPRNAGRPSVAAGPALAGESDLLGLFPPRQSANQSGLGENLR
jgi:hypothetical protein